MRQRRPIASLPLTRSQWIRSVILAWEESECAICGHGQEPPTVDDEGFVWQYCERCQVTRALAREYPPASFAPEPDDYDDLPF